MTPREVVQATFRFEQTDPVPYHIPIDEDVQRRLDAHYGNTAWRERLVPYVQLGHLGGGREDRPDGTQRDLFGTVVRPGNIMHIVQPALAGPSLAGYDWPDVEALADWDALAARPAGAREPYRMFGLGYGLFERAWLMRGMEALLMDMLDAPAFVEELMDGIEAVHFRAIDLVADRLAVDAYFAGDDWSGQRGPIMGLGPWRRFIKPRLARLIERAHERGLPLICHSCGNVLPLVDDLLEIGLDGLESLQPEAMDVYELKRRTHGRMVLVGGMGTQSTLPFGTPRDVRDETRRLLRELGRGGGYVLAPAKPLLPDVPTANAVAFLEAAAG